MQARFQAEAVAGAGAGAEAGAGAGTVARESRTMRSAGSPSASASL